MVERLPVVTSRRGGECFDGRYRCTGLRIFALNVTPRGGQGIREFRAVA
jgi:hypothetical protein